MSSALHDRFRRGLAGSATRTAVRVGARSVTYEELHERALCWAGWLLHATDGAPGPVAVLAGKGIESYAGVLAALYAGAPVVPLNPAFPAARTAQMLASSGARAVLADEPGVAALAATGLDLPVLAPAVHSPEPRLALHEPLPVRGSDVAYMLFTSGSTGRPKGVPITHDNTHHYFQLIDKRYDFGEDDVFSQTFDLNFDCAMFDLFCAWGAGAAVHPLPAQAYRDLPEFAAQRRMTVWFSTPSGIALVRKMGGLAPGALPTLRWSLFAGEALRCDDAADWLAAARLSTVENLYGPTELTITVTAHRWSPGDSPARGINGLTPIGTVHEGHDHLLVDAAGEPCDAEGELCVTGPQLTAGYLDPGDDEGRFLRRDGRRWYRTGDRVRRLADGELVYLGRLDAQVQVQGWRVELAEIEHAVRACAGVTDAVTVTRPADSGVELVVFYTGAPSGAAELTRQLREILPHGMLPRRFHHLEDFPLNANRKIDRGLLARRAAASV